MAKKLLIIILTSSIIAYIIFINNKNNTTNILYIGDAYIINHSMINNYFNKYKVKNCINTNLLKKDYKLEDFQKDLNNNIIINKKHIKNIINKADIIVLTFGMEELTERSLLNKLNLNFVKNYLVLYDNTIKEIKKNNDNLIYLVGLYNNNIIDNSFAIIINSELANIAKIHNIKYIDIYNKDNFNNIIYLNIINSL